LKFQAEVFWVVTRGNVTLKMEAGWTSEALVS